MTVARASRLGSSLGRTFLRRPGIQGRTQAWKQAGRRFYASEHTSKSSDIPWIIGSVALTTPAAVWLWSQGPSGGHGHDESHEKSEEKEEGGSEDKEESDADTKDASKDEKPAKEEKKDDKSEKKSGDSGSESSDSDSSDEGDAKDTPPSSDDSDSDDEGKGKGSGKGKTETKGEKDSAKDQSGAKHPSLDDSEKSKKAEGVTDTAKIHGTVDPSRSGK